MRAARGLTLSRRIVAKRGQDQTVDEPVRTSVQHEDRSAVELRKKLADLLGANERVAFAYLFGSRAFGLEREGSDVDLAIYYARPVSLWEALRLQEDSAEALGFPVQVVSLNSSIRSCVLQTILEHGMVVKHSPLREEWAKRAEALLKVKGEEIRKDRRRPLLDSVKEKIHLLRQVLPKLKEVSLQKALAGNIDEQARFIGLFMRLYEATEAAIRKVASLEALAEKGKPPASLSRAIEKVREPLSLSAETVEVLRALKPLRDTLARAYWEINTEVLKKFDKAAVERGLRELQVALAEYVLEQERTLTGE